MFGYLTCSACHDTWSHEMIDQEIQAYIEANPELKKPILAGEITDVDLGEVLCDGCEDFYRETDSQNDPWNDDYLDPDTEDDTDGDYASWLCASCGDPAYDCGCDGDVEDEIDRKAELMRLGRL